MCVGVAYIGADGGCVVDGGVGGDVDGIDVGVVVVDDGVVIAGCDVAGIDGVVSGVGAVVVLVIVLAVVSVLSLWYGVGACGIDVVVGGVCVIAGCVVDDGDVGVVDDVGR